MYTREELETEIEQIKEDIENFQLDESDYIEQYDNMLDECYPELFGLLPSRILSECDPIQYNCGLSDYVSSLDITEDDKYKELEESLEELESELEELEEEK